MSNTRHRDDEPLVRGYAVTHPPGTAQVRIQDGWDQLLYTARGVLTIRSSRGVWTIPPDRAVRVPAGERIVLVNRRPVAVRAVYLRSLTSSPATGVLGVPDFGRALLLHVVRACPLYADRPVHRALRTVLLDELDRWSAAPLGLPLPQDPRGRAFAEAAHFSPRRSAVIAREIGTSVRTLERIFQGELGLGLGAWRRRATILASLDTLLATGSVTDAAMAAGYSTSSAYITAFRRELDGTPGAYLRASAS